MTTGTVVFGVAETAARLEESFETLRWAVGMAPSAWHHRPPPFQRPGGELPWSIAQNLAHMLIYEETAAAPVLEELLAGGDGSLAVPSWRDERFSEERVGFARLSREPVAELLDRLGRARRRQVDAVRTFSSERFNTKLTSLWGPSGQRPGWVATKTFQHTWEHGNSILQVALFAPRQDITD